MQQRASRLLLAMMVGTARQGRASVSPAPSATVTGAARSPPALPSPYKPPRQQRPPSHVLRASAGGCSAGNHGNCQVSLSLPLPLTLRCHRVPATSRAPPRSCPGVRGCGTRGAVPGPPAPPAGSWRRAAAAGPCPGPGARGEERGAPRQAHAATSASVYPGSPGQVLPEIALGELSRASK